MTFYLIPIPQPIKTVLRHFELYSNKLLKAFLKKISLYDSMNFNLIFKSIFKTFSLKFISGVYSWHQSIGRIKFKYN